MDNKLTKNPAAVALGSKGGKARARKLSKKRRIEIATRGAEARIEALKKRDDKNKFSN